MKHQALFSSKDKSKKLKCRLLQFLCGALRIKMNRYTSIVFYHFIKETNFYDFKFASLNDEALKHGISILERKNLLLEESKFCPLRV